MRNATLDFLRVQINLDALFFPVPVPVPVPVPDQAAPKDVGGAVGAGLVPARASETFVFASPRSPARWAPTSCSTATSEWRRPARPSPATSRATALRLPPELDALMRRTLSKERDEKNAQLLRMDKLKDEFLANTSHELRATTPPTSRPPTCRCAARSARDVT